MEHPDQGHFPRSTQLLECLGKGGGGEEVGNSGRELAFAGLHDARTQTPTLLENRDNKGHVSRDERDEEREEGLGRGQGLGVEEEEGSEAVGSLHTQNP